MSVCAACSGGMEIKMQKDNDDRRCPFLVCLRNEYELHIGGSFLYCTEDFQHGGAVVAQRLLQRGKPVYFDRDISKPVEAAVKAVLQGVPILAVVFRQTEFLLEQLMNFTGILAATEVEFDGAFF